MMLGPALLTLLGVVAWQLHLLVTVGQSVGKRMLGIKVVRTDGGPVDLPRLIFLRNVVPTLLGLGLIDALFILTVPRRCLHDYLADTQVILVPRSG